MTAAGKREIGLKLQSSLDSALGFLNSRSRRTCFHFFRTIVDSKEAFSTLLRMGLTIDTADFRMSGRQQSGSEPDLQLTKSMAESTGEIGLKYLMQRGIAFSDKLPSSESHCQVTLEAPRSIYTSEDN